LRWKPGDVFTNHEGSDGTEVVTFFTVLKDGWKFQGVPGKLSTEGKELLLPNLNHQLKMALFGLTAIIGLILLMHYVQVKTRPFMAM